MLQPLVRVTRAAMAAVVLVFAAGACDSSPEIPTAPEGEIPFNAIAINEATAQPTSGATLQAGSQASYFAEVFFQVTPEEFAQFEDVIFDFWVEVFDDEFGWEGDVVSEFVVEERSTGSQVFEGTFSAPVNSAFCGPYDEIKLAAFLFTVTGDDNQDDQDQAPPGEKAAGGELFTRTESAAVTGATGPQGSPCLLNWDPGESIFAVWGYDRISWIRSVPNSEVKFLPGLSGDRTVEFLVGDQQVPATILWQIPIDYRDGSYTAFISWLPTGAGTGATRAFVEGSETVYGLGSPWVADFFAGSEDIFDWWFGRNDAFENPAVDFFGRPWVSVDGQFVWLAVNPHLSIDEGDRAVDAAANPLGSETWGVGDWIELPIDYTMDVCAAIYMDTQDDIDLLIFDDQGNELGRSTAAAGTESEFVFLGAVPGGSTLRLWVAPFDIATETGSYSLSAADCAWWFGDVRSAPAAGPAMDVARRIEEEMRSRVQAMQVEGGLPSLRELRGAIPPPERPDPGRLPRR